MSLTHNSPRALQSRANSTIGKAFGYLTTDQSGTTVLTKRIRFSIHLLQKFEAIAFNTEVLENARAKGVSLIHVHDQDDNQDYYTDFATFDRLGQDVQFPNYEPQRYLKLKYWVKDPSDLNKPGSETKKMLEFQAPLKVKQFRLFDAQEVVYDN